MTPHSFQTEDPVTASSDEEWDPFELPRDAEEWHALYDEDVEALYGEVREAFEEGGYPLMGKARLPDFSEFCYGVFTRDRRVPWKARLGTVPPYLEGLDNGGYPDSGNVVSRKRAYEPWCLENRDALRMSYLLVVPELLDRGFTDLYLEDWARYVFSVSWK